MFGDALQARWGAWHLRAAVVTTASPPGSGGHASVLEQAAEGLREILEVVRALGRIADEAELLDLINMTVRVKLGCNVCAIAIKGDDGVFRYSATSGLDAEADSALRSRELGPSAFVALREAAVRIGAVCWVPPEHPVRDRPDVIAGMLPVDSSIAPGAPRSGPLLFAPLIGADGEALGLLSPADPLNLPFPGPRQTLLLETLAELTVVGLEIVRARAVERAAVAVAEAQRRQLEDLLAASAQIRGYYSLDEVLREIARAMTTAGGFSRAAIYLRMPDDALVVGATVGLTEAESKQLSEIPVSLAEFAEVMQPEMLLSRSYFLDHRRFVIRPELNDKLNTPVGAREWQDGEWHPEDMLTVKIVDSVGELLGLISVDEPVNGLIPDRAHVQAIEFFADQCAVAVAHARRYEQVRTEALTDPLTGLANRRALDAAVVRAIARARRDSALCTVLFIDVDHFKDINDSLGHAVGDSVLQAVGRGLRDRLRRGDILARYGGEEFVALLPDTDLPAALRVAEILRKRVASLDFGSLTGGLPVRVSIGVAQLSEELMGAGSLVSAADSAMYASQRLGRNRGVGGP